MLDVSDEALVAGAVPSEYTTLAFTYPCPGCGCENVCPYRKRDDQTVHVWCVACGWTQQAFFIKVRPELLSARVHEEVAREEKGGGRKMRDPAVLDELVDAVNCAALHRPSWRRLRLALSPKERDEIRKYMVLRFGEYLGKIMGVPLVVEMANHGRPLEKDRVKSLAALKPWEKEGMSRRTWFRRRAEDRE